MKNKKIAIGIFSVLAVLSLIMTVEAGTYYNCDGAYASGGIWECCSRNFCPVDMCSYSMDLTCQGYNKIYNINFIKCCDGTMFGKGGPCFSSTGSTATCNLHQTSTCCSGDGICCTSQVSGATYGSCCSGGACTPDWELQNVMCIEDWNTQSCGECYGKWINSDGSDACCYDELYNPLEQHCCGGGDICRHKLCPGNDPEEEGYEQCQDVNEDGLFDGCCNGELCDLNGDEEGLIEGCCSGGMVCAGKKEYSNGICADVISELGGFEHECKECNTQYDCLDRGFEQAGCCYGKCYDVKKDLCCGNACESSLIDIASNGGWTDPLTKLSPIAECCGLEGYNTQNQSCCNTTSNNFDDYFICNGECCDDDKDNCDDNCPGICTYFDLTDKKDLPDCLQCDTTFPPDEVKDACYVCDSIFFDEWPGIDDKGKKDSCYNCLKSGSSPDVNYPNGCIDNPFLFLKAVKKYSKCPSGTGGYNINECLVNCNYLNKRCSCIDYCGADLSVPFPVC